MTNQPNIDPALAAHLEELALLAREIGAEEVVIIRGPERASIYLTYEKMSQRPKVLNVSNLSNRPAGVLVVLRFPQSDGGAAGIEVK